MGGPYMEDFRIAYRSLGITKHVSIESKKTVCDRQRFNSPISGITFVNSTMAKYIADYEPDSPSIFWLDYASADRQGQVRELQTLLGKIQAGDIIKITLNAEPYSIAPSREDGKPYSLDELADAILGPFKEKFGIEEENLISFMLLPNGDLDPRLGAAKALARYVKRQAGAALRLRSRDKLLLSPITAFRYTDERQQMLTLTAVILQDTPSSHDGADDAKDVDALLEEVLAAHNWGSKDWEDIHLIDVPDLSIREKLTVDAVPFDDPEDNVLTLWNHSLGMEISSAKVAIRSYRKFARYYPVFGRLHSRA